MRTTAPLRIAIVMSLLMSFALCQNEVDELKIYLDKSQTAIIEKSSLFEPEMEYTRVTAEDEGAYINRYYRQN